MGNKSRAYNFKDASKITGLSEDTITESKDPPKTPSMRFKVGDLVHVVDDRTGITIWSGIVIRQIQGNRSIMVESHTIRNKHGELLRARFALTGHAIDIQSPSHRHLVMQSQEGILS